VASWAPLVATQRGPITAENAADSLPMQLFTYDTVSFASDTVWVSDAKTAYTYINEARWYTVFRVSGDSHVVIDFNDAVLYFDTSGHDSATAIALHNSDHIQILGPGEMIREIGPGYPDGHAPRCIDMEYCIDVYVDSIDMTIDGHRGTAIYTRYNGYDIVFRDFEITNNSESFDDRQYFESGGIYNGRIELPPPEGHWGVEIINVDVLNSPHFGHYFGTHWDYPIKCCSCSVFVDAQNDYWDTTGCAPDCPTGHSADNAYGIMTSGIGAGTKIFQNIVIAGNEEQGCRGIMIENAHGTADSMIEVYNNTLHCQCGPSGETNGEARTFKIRQEGESEGRWHDYVWVHDNDINAYVDDSVASTARSDFGVALDWQMAEQDSIWGHVIIENNTIALWVIGDSGCTVYGRAAELGTEEQLPSQYAVNATFRNNHFKSGDQLIWFGQNYSKNSARDIILSGDTFSFWSSGDTGTLSGNPQTYYVGGDWGNCYDNWVLDGTFLTTASDSDITLRDYGGHSNELFIKRTVNLYVKRGGSYQSGASVWVVNNYGDTVGSGTTNASGLFVDTVSYYYSGQAGDSGAFNDFTWGCTHSGDTATNASFTVASAASGGTDTLDLGGEEPTVRQFQGITLKGIKP